jgi:hypothetical protein
MRLMESWNWINLQLKKIAINIYMLWRFIQRLKNPLSGRIIRPSTQEEIGLINQFFSGESWSFCHRAHRSEACRDYRLHAELRLSDQNHVLVYG